MSAWARLVARTSPEDLEELIAAVLEIQEETAYLCAQQQRAWAEVTQNEAVTKTARSIVIAITSAAADHIYPKDKEPSWETVKDTDDARSSCADEGPGWFTIPDEG